MTHHFADCELDRERFALRRAGTAVKVEPKVFDVLAYLLDHRERVVTKDELLGALWPGEAVSESVLPRCIAAARRAVGDDRAAQRIIQTVHGRGYRFIAELKDGANDSPKSVPATTAAHVAEAPERTTRPFVGREAAMAKLSAALDDACAGRGRVAMLVGEPGIGKTRAIEELARLAQERGAVMLVARCYEGDGAPAFWPWTQVLRAALRSVPEVPLDATATDVAELLPELRARASDAAIGDEQARFRLFDGVATHLRNAASRAPLVIALDDLHWADAASLLLFEFTASEWRDARILLIGSYRDVDVRREHALSGVLGALARLPHVERLALRGLARDDVAQILEAALERAPDPRLLGAVHEMTDGNPFFLLEMTRWIAESGDAAEPAEGAAWSLALPQSVRDAVGRRLDRLSPACNAMLRAAAVLGREFTGAALARVANLDAEDVLEGVGEALAAHVLVEVRESPGRYAFGHALVRQTLYEELRVPERVRLHRRAGEALEALHAGDPDAHAAEIAHHFFEAAPGGDAKAAITWAVRAAQHARDVFAYEESARHCERALAALEQDAAPDDARRIELMLMAAEAHYAAGARDRARALCHAAATIARRLGRSDLLARAAVEYRGGQENGLPPEPETLALLHEALDAVGDRDPRARARLLARLAGTESSMDERDRLSREAYVLAVASGAADAMRDALASRWWATLGPDHVAERGAVAREILDEAARRGDPRLELLGWECRLGETLIRGDMRAAEAAVDAYWRRAEELREPAFRFLARVLRGGCALGAGRFDEAESLFNEAWRLGRGRVPFADAMFGGQVYWLALQRGDGFDLDAARSFFEDLQRRYPGVRLLMRTVLADALASKDPASARREFDAIAAHGFRDLPRDENYLLVMGLLCDLCFAFDDAPRAAQLTACIAPYAELFVVHDLVRATAGSAESLLGELALVQRQADVAIAHYERATTRDAAAGLRPSELSSRTGLACALALRGGPGDAKRAEALMREVETGCAAIDSREEAGRTGQRAGAGPLSFGGGGFARLRRRFESVVSRGAR